MKFNQRKQWVAWMNRVVRPVFENLSNGELRQKMPIEKPVKEKDYSNCEQRSHLEAFGRAYAGIAPWLELSEISDEEEKVLHDEYLGMVRRSVENAVDPQSPDFMNFTEGRATVVDGAYVAHGLLRSWESVWVVLDDTTQKRVVECLRKTREHCPVYNNWLLFSAMVEVFLFKAGEKWDRMRVDYALRQHEQWYVGDGMYADGYNFHWDYYNSFVIQPMLYEIVNAGGEISEKWGWMRDGVVKRARRYAGVQERMISPEGFFPPIGRSLVYRFGAFQNLALMALKKDLPDGVVPAGVRCALSAVIKRMLTHEELFDEEGWLRIGFCGHQPEMGEGYISTGSLYMTSLVFLPLGLSATEPFWSDEDADWTSKRIWNGEDMGMDKGISRHFPEVPEPIVSMRDF